MATSILRSFFLIVLFAPLFSTAQVADYTIEKENQTCNATSWKTEKDTVYGIVSQTNCKDIKPDMNITGTWKIYNSDTTKVVAIIGVKTKRLNGQKIVWHDNGTKEVTNYFNNLLKGTYTNYYANGKIELTGENINNQPVDTWTGYWDNGSKSYETFYDKSGNCSPTKQKFYDKAGKKISQEEWTKLKKASTN